MGVHPHNFGVGQSALHAADRPDRLRVISSQDDGVVSLLDCLEGSEGERVGGSHHVPLVLWLLDIVQLLVSEV